MMGRSYLSAISNDAGSGVDEIVFLRIQASMIGRER